MHIGGVAVCSEIGAIHRTHLRPTDIQALTTHNSGDTIFDAGHLAVRGTESAEGRAAYITRGLCLEQCRSTFYRRDDRLVKVAPLLEVMGIWTTFLSADCSYTEYEAIRLNGRTERPLSSDDFLSKLEVSLGRSITAERLVLKVRQGSSEGLICIESR